ELQQVAVVLQPLVLERQQHAPRIWAAAPPVHVDRHVWRIVECDMREFTTLIDATTLSSQLERADFALFDCRFELGNPSWGESQYTESHIPGAQYLHLDRDLSGPITRTSGRHPLPDPHAFARRVGELGGGPDTQLIAYDQGNGAYGARFWWLS